MKNRWKKLPKRVKRYSVIALVVLIFAYFAKIPGWAFPSIIIIIVFYELGGFAALASLFGASSKDE